MIGVLKLLIKYIYIYLNKQTNLDDQRFEVVKLGSCFLKINILKKKFG